MMIDIIFVILLVLALIHGYRRGLIVAVFSLVSIVVGLAAAIKLSAVVANHLGNTVKVSDKWLPVISFAIVFIVVVLLIRLGARAIQKLTEALMLGWLNRLGRCYSLRRDLHNNLQCCSFLCKPGKDHQTRSDQSFC
jgi:membrane protein required for colicin V production